MSALQDWLRDNNRRLSQEAIDEALMEYITHVEKQRDDLVSVLERILQNDGAEGSKCFDALELYDARVDARCIVASVKGGAA